MSIMNNRDGYCFLIDQKKKLVVIQYNEWLSSKRTRPFLDEIAVSGYNPGMNWVVDMRLSDFNGYDHDSIYKTMLKRDEIAQKIPHKIGFIATQKHYGYLRQITQEANAYVGGCDARDFTCIEELLTWLQVPLDDDICKMLVDPVPCPETSNPCESEPQPASP